MTKALKIALVIALSLLAVALFALRCYWADTQKVQAVFFLLQFIGALLLLVATVHYASAAWALVDAQNREPEICVPDRPILPVAPTSAGDEFSMQFLAVISNPGIRSTSLRVESVEINGVAARNVSLSYSGYTMRPGVTVRGGGLVQVTVNAGFTDLSVSPASRLRLVVKDLFREKSLPVEVNWGV